MSLSWTQAICLLCWVARNPGRDPVTLTNPVIERCAYCGIQTQAGIYVRDDPANVKFPLPKEA